MLIIHSNETGNKEEMLHQPLNILILFLIREKLIGKTIDKLRKTIDYCNRIENEDIRSNFSHDEIDLRDLNFDEIKNHRMEVIEDCLLIIRNNLSFISKSGKIHLMKLVEIVSGTFKFPTTSQLIKTENRIRIRNCQTT